MSITDVDKTDTRYFSSGNDVELNLSEERQLAISGHDLETKCKRWKMEHQVFLPMTQTMHVCPTRQVRQVKK